MTSVEFHTVGASWGIDAALYKLRNSKSRSLFVVDNGKLAGVLFERDIRKHLLNGGDFTAKCGWLANETIFINENDVANAQDIMRDGGLSILPVVNSDGILVDVVTADNGVKMRLLNRNDVFAVTNFFDNMDREGHDFFNHGDYNRVELLKWLTGDCADKTQIHFGAFQQSEDGEGAMVGYLLFVRLNTSTPWLGIAINREFKGQGLGERILLYADEYAKKIGAGGIFLTTAIANRRGQSLYSKMGYKQLGVHTSGEYLYFKNL